MLYHAEEYINKVKMLYPQQYLKVFFVSNEKLRLTQYTQWVTMNKYDGYFHVYLWWVYISLVMHMCTSMNHKYIPVAVASLWFKKYNFQFRVADRYPDLLMICIILGLLPRDLADDKSTLIQVMALCCQATRHYLSQCWPRSILAISRHYAIMS